MMLPLLLLLMSRLINVMAFSPVSPSTFSPIKTKTSTHILSIQNSRAAIQHVGDQSAWSLFATSGDASSEDDPNETVARRIVVVGDVNGGYYRTCVINEARRFRKLSGTMSPPDGGDRAEIYVEGKRKSIESFIRWCRRGDVGLSQSIKVENVAEEFPTGLYDDFYVDTGR